MFGFRPLKMGYLFTLWRTSPWGFWPIKNGIQIAPVEPPPLDCTPFKIVEHVRDLKELAAKLRNVHEFAVDLEHNQYRSFQGLTCLMQISTRNEDFVIDTLKLRIHVGPYLREVFKDPSKRKVMHGADKDVLWLQRDFGIYICNMFDTGQGSKVLNLERNSLEYLLNHFCGLQANKEYQNADWRLRPLPDEMQKYAREDTHYLLYIYDLMRKELLSLDADSECPGTSLLEVYKRSYSTCMLLYEKDLLTDSSFRSVYGVPGAGLSAEQLAVVSALCQWRDVVARSEDESTGFILPNRTLVEIAKEVPLTTSKLRRFVRSKHPYVERNLGSVVSIIRDAIQNSAAFEDAAEELKVNLKGSENNVATAEDEVFPEADNIDISTPPKIQSACGNYPVKISSNNLHENGNVKGVTDGSEAAAAKPATDAVANVEVLKKPSRAFGALLGNSSKRKLLPDKSEPEQMKLEQIISAVNLPFLPFVTMVQPAFPVKPSLTEEPVSSETTSKAEDIILLNSDNEDPPNVVFEPVEKNTDQTEHCGRTGVCGNDEEDDGMSLSDLSSSFQKCFQSINESRRVERREKSQGHEGGLLQLKPFDYEAARKQVIFGKASRREEGDDNRSRVGKGNNRKASSAGGGVAQSQQAEDLPQGKRRQAFPTSGNRSATFRQF
ncbi:hypothetical protein Leryth_025189 [Lithospermum erythrorhizon]|nr:hypothetical protein Leryth_025189 [Lithospermum erythrorhizon]